MTVDEMIAELRKFPGHATVVIQCPFPGRPGVWKTPVSAQEERLAPTSRHPFGGQFEVLEPGIRQGDQELNDSWDAIDGLRFKTESVSLDQGAIRRHSRRRSRRR